MPVSFNPVKNSGGAIMFNNFRDHCNKQRLLKFTLLKSRIVCALWNFKANKLLQPITSYELHYSVWRMSKNLLLLHFCRWIDYECVMLNLGKMNVINIHKLTSQLNENKNNNRKFVRKWETEYILNMAEAESDVYNAAVEHGGQCIGVDRLTVFAGWAKICSCGVSLNERCLCKLSNRYSKLYHFAWTIFTLCMVIGNQNSKAFRDDPVQHVFASPETRETMLSHKGHS